MDLFKISDNEVSNRGNGVKFRHELLWHKECTQFFRVMYFAETGTVFENKIVSDNESSPLYYYLFAYIGTVSRYFCNSVINDVDRPFVAISVD